ncbi:MAG: ATP-binding cassette domain-containing protein [Ardenticatenaceae bacterium]|nr:ATP-binding cassette domain-containing protein [Ardenticatenaceae bacterium]HBY94454.1 daunorubicin ABC transporter ATP-binding protein [Chloroflexota bacterium]
MPDASALAIDARRLSRRYTLRDGEIAAVTDLDLKVPAGTIYALLGPNGAGKTTTISMLTTVVAPSSGTALVAGYDIEDEPDMVRANIGVTFQDIVLDEDLTGREVLEIHARLYRMPTDLRHQRIERLVELAELGGAIDRWVKTYSGGMKRRLELIRGLLTGPRVLFLDEPTQGLDPQNRVRIWEYLQTLMRSGVLTVLLTTHSMEEAEALADRVGIIDHGRLVVEGAPAELVTGMGADVITIRGHGRADDLVAALRRRPYVQSLLVGRPNGSTDIQIGVDQGNRRLAEIVTIASQDGFAIEDLSIARPSLGDVFLKYTGRALRDE